MGWSDKGEKTKRNILICAIVLIAGPGFFLVQRLMMPEQGANRPMLRPEGCPPWAGGCPVNMFCILDAEMPWYGRCECRRSHGQVRRSPTFDDREVDDTYVPGKECFPDYAVTIPQLLVALPFFFTHVMFAKVALKTLWGLVHQNEKFKWNSTTRGLVLIIMAFGINGVVFLAFMLAFLGLDPYSWARDILMSGGQNACNAFTFVALYELCLSWVELVEKSVRMSRTSSKWMTFLKWFIRFLQLGVNVAFTFFIRDLGGNAERIYTSIQTYQHMVVQLVPGIILTRMLCKDPKDVTNPNWKAAQVIRRTFTMNLKGLIILQISMQAIIWTVVEDLTTYKLGVPFWYTVTWAYVATAMMAWGMLHYILFGCRKLVQDTDSDKISQYFGFTTVGLNSTIASGVSRFSSTASSVASMASTASTIEKDDDNKAGAENKGEAA